MKAQQTISIGINEKETEFLSSLSTPCSKIHVNTNGGMGGGYRTIYGNILERNKHFMLIEDLVSGETLEVGYNWVSYIVADYRIMAYVTHCLRGNKRETHYYAMSKNTRWEHTTPNYHNGKALYSTSINYVPLEEAEEE